MTEVQDRLELARDSFRRRAWQQAHRQLSVVDDARALGAEDLERLAHAAYLTGQDAEWERTMARACRGFLDEHDPEAAARCAFWLGLTLLVRGEEARGGGWLARAQRLVEERIEGEGPVTGYLVAARGYQQLGGDDAVGALAAFTRAAEIGERVDEDDLAALGLLGCGQACVVLGEADRAARLFDEVMVRVESGEVSAIAAGLVYCAVILACQELYDLRRAQQWTRALSEWCAGQPELVPFAGQCLVHRSELAQLRGDWAQAAAEAERACERLAVTPGGSGGSARGMALYQRGELARLRGDLAAAEAAYDEASRCGRTPHPGLALLRLAQGRLEDALPAIRHVPLRVGEAPTRADVLGARVEIALAAGGLDEARRAADELADLATGPRGPALHPVAAQARGALLLADGDPAAALPLLHEARDAWRALGAPYQQARVTVLVSRCLEALDDHDTARVERNAAREVFARLGARPDLERLGADGARDSSHASGLTPREVTVVRLVARGMTNRQIADELVISQKTVARHVHNIITKCGLTNRAAATAWAYEHRLLR